MRPRSEEVKKIPVSELVDRRVKGMSFGDMAEEYGMSKSIIYGYYQECAKRGFDGYDPLGVENIARMCRTEYTFPEMSRLLGITPMGLRNYMDDYHVPGREINLRTVKRLVSIGKTEAFIGQYYGMTQQCVGRWCKRNGVEIPRNNNWKIQQELYAKKLAEKDNNKPELFTALK